MYVIGHYDGQGKIDALFVLIKARIQSNGTNRFGEQPALVSAESKEVSFTVTLQMGKLTTVKSPLA